MEKLANLESRIEQIKEEASRNSPSEALRKRVMTAGASSDAFLGPEEDDDLSPLIRPQKVSSTCGSETSCIGTPVSLPEPTEKSSDSRLSAFLDNTWLDRNHGIVFLGVELLLWATIFYIFVVLEFGFVYFTLSILYFIWRNTRTRRRKDGELSAYSVFNPNCEPIHGTVSPTQLTRELGLAVPMYS